MVIMSCPGLRKGNKLTSSYLYASHWLILGMLLTLSQLTLELYKQDRSCSLLRLHLVFSKRSLRGAVEFLPSMLEVLGLILRTITTTTSSNTSTATTPSPPPPPPPQKLGMVANVCNFCTWELRQEKCHEFEASQVSSNPTQITEWVFVSRKTKLSPTSPQGLGMKPRNGVLASIIPSDFSGVSAVCCFCCCYCRLLIWHNPGSFGKETSPEK